MTRSPQWWRGEERRIVVNSHQRTVLDEMMLIGAADVGELIVVRHGQQVIGPAADPSRPRQGDQPLSELGLRQAEMAADALASERLDAVFASDLARARKTAEAIASRHGIAVQIDRRLREIEVYRDVPAGTAVTDAVEPATLRASRQAFFDSGRWDSFVASEPSAEFVERIFGALVEIAARYPGAARVAIVCHAGVINTLLARIMGLSADVFCFPAHASISRVASGEGRFVIRSVGEAAHLRDAVTY